MQEIQRETGTTFLLSTHDRELAERCERRIVIRGGIVVDGAEPTASRAESSNGLRMIDGEVTAVIDHTHLSSTSDDRRRA
jgi:ABC-type multidrug transport system ATPase subunit